MLNGIHINRLIQDKFFRYSTPSLWNNQYKSFYTIHSTLKLLPWIFANFLLLPWVAIFNSVVVIVSYSTSIYTDINILQLFIVVVQLLLTVTIVVGCYDMWQNSNQWALFLNCLLDFQCGRSTQRKSLSGKWQPYRKQRQTFNELKSIKVNFRDMLYLSKDPNILDVYGLILNLVIFCSSGFQLIIPPFVFLFKLDSPYHFFRIVLPAHLYANPISHGAVQIVRIFIGSWSVCEGVNTIRTCVLYFFFLLRVYSQHLTALRNGRITEHSIIDYNALVVLYSLVNDSLRVVVPVYFGMIYWVLVLVQTLSVVGLNVFEWHFYISIPLCGFFGLILMILAWKMAVLLDDHSRKLKGKWIIALADRENQWPHRRNLLRKMVKALRPISISYGSLGTIRRATRVSYMYNMLSDTVQMILTVRKYGM